jgi:hypothetical protein
VPGNFLLPAANMSSSSTVQAHNPVSSRLTACHEQIEKLGAKLAAAHPAIDRLPLNSPGHSAREIEDFKFTEGRRVVNELLQRADGIFKSHITMPNRSLTRAGQAVEETLNYDVKALEEFLQSS